MALYHHSEGRGEPLLLLHAFGLSHEVWAPLIPLLAPGRRVLLVDLPGHGRSSMPPSEIPPSPAGYAQMIGALLDELGLDRVDMAGNSIGGWTALELALAGRAHSVVALSPAGLWPGRAPRMREVRFLAEHVGARAAGPLLWRGLHTAQGRALILGSAMASARSLSAQDAVALVRAYAGTQQMTAHIRARRGQRFTGGRGLTIPVTVAWGAQDRFIPPETRSRKELPDHVRWLELPGCGHVMMWDAPELVVQTILEGTTRPVQTAD
jgi:pimeloyl-ACP methyl ester carboxylesterase